MSISAGAQAFKLQFAVSPVILTRGIASLIPGNALPMLSISSAIQFTGGLLSPANSINNEDYFAIWQSLPGGTLISQDLGEYPFANQTVAANATIKKPLTISMVMICPAGNGGGYLSKFATMQSIQQTLEQHNESGGLYTVMTSAFPYVDCCLIEMTDMSTSQTHQQQNAYRLDFRLPLVTQQQADNAQNALMGTISAQVPASATSGPGLLAGNPSGAMGPAFLPSGGIGGEGIPGYGGPSSGQGSSLNNGLGIGAA